MKKTGSLLGKSPTRRQVLGGIGAGLVAAPFVLSSRSTFAADPLVLVTWGGSFTDVTKAVITDPFTAETGIGVNIVAGPDLAKAKAQVTTGNLEWDLFDGSGGTLLNAAKEGLFEELDTSIVDTSGLVGSATQHLMPFLPPALRRGELPRPHRPAHARLGDARTGAAGGWRRSGEPLSARCGAGLRSARQGQAQGSEMD
jgi:hypothetical protein